MDVERGRPVVVVMGVSGSGKTTVGRLLARRLDVEYAEGDEFHPPANVAKMTSGSPLDDEDRRHWLDTVAEWIEERLGSGRGGVVSCSALKRRYRDVLRRAGSGVWFLQLDVDLETIEARVAERTGHFMPVSLVESQFAMLEPLGSDERGAVVDARSSPEETAENAAALLAE
ncbi:gluconokinase [Actinocorallia aurantiaca]|uniref:Gluconokinase n=1 Tax=Actinocorallia aurantiaca TaxID=46204 RepID=A0ABP6GRZ7_9ACTN